MKIKFFENEDGKSQIGSYRIWVKGLNDLGQRLGFPVSIGKTLNAEIVIFPKGLDQKANLFKTRNPKRLVGTINPEPQPTSLDFAICGSIEERDSLLRFFPRVFIFPLIETMYKERKKHSKKSPLLIGYHGNSIHLNSLQPTIASALLEFSKIEPIKLIVITDQKIDMQWINRLPEEIDTSIFLWERDSIESNLLSIDIGIVPSCYTGITASKPDWASKTNLNWSHDYVLRFKNKTNAGRAFVFHQLGIPVIADFAPSHFHIMGDPKCGVLAHSLHGWLDGLYRFQDPDERAIVAKNALNRFNELYNAETHARTLFEQLLQLRSIRKLSLNTSF